MEYSSQEVPGTCCRRDYQQAAQEIQRRSTDSGGSRLSRTDAQQEEARTEKKRGQADDTPFSCCFVLVVRGATFEPRTMIV